MIWKNSPMLNDRISIMLNFDKFSASVATPDYVYNCLEWASVLWRSLVFLKLSQHRLSTPPQIVSRIFSMLKYQFNWACGSVTGHSSRLQLIYIGHILANFEKMFFVAWTKICSISNIVSSQFFEIRIKAIQYIVIPNLKLKNLSIPHLV